MKTDEKRQAYNPFLPLHECIPDGEPHIFGDRVYHYGSHDLEGGYTFCMQDYVVYSAPIDDLTNWRYEGVSYRADQDPHYPNLKFMYAPDVVQGNDGKYYLYYCMGGDYGYGGYTRPISVAVSDKPAGPFEFLGYVKYSDGTPMWKYVCFDPAALNDNGTIRIYYGTQYDFEEREDFDDRPDLMQEEINMFGRTAEQINAYRKEIESCRNGIAPAKDKELFAGGEPNAQELANAGAICNKNPDSIMGACMVVLEDDMLTVKEEPRHIIPYKVKGTSFEVHPFFEASSMRKIGEKYYFIYSSMQNHELCYATSDYPDRDFVFGGTIVSNGDVGLNGRTDEDKHNMTGTTHGSIIEINGQWYVFYHRLTHKSDYSRQACAEKITIEADGSIKQVEITSCGLNDGPLLAHGGECYPAVIACNITNGRMPHGCNSIYQIAFPNVTNIGDDRFIGEIEEGTLLGYKYFDFQGIKEISIVTRKETEKNLVVFDGPVRVDVRCDGEAEKSSNKGNDYSDKTGDATTGYFEIRLVEAGEEIGRIPASTSEEWEEMKASITVPDGVSALYLIYHGQDKVQLKEMGFRA